MWELITTSDWRPHPCHSTHMPTTTRTQICKSKNIAPTRNQNQGGQHVGNDYCVLRPAHIFACNPHKNPSTHVHTHTHMQVRAHTHTHTVSSTLIGVSLDAYLTRTLWASHQSLDARLTGPSALDSSVWAPCIYHPRARPSMVAMVSSQNTELSLIFTWSSTCS